MEEAEKSVKELVVHPDRSMSAPARVLYLEPMNLETSRQSDSAGLLDYWQLVRIQLHLIIAMIIGGAFLALVLSFWQTPIYQARISMEIQNPNDHGMNVRIGDLETDTASPSPESYLPTQ